MKNILVVGGSYFAGKAFVEELQDSSEYTLYLINRGTRPLNLEGVQEIVCDRHDGEKLAEVVPPLAWHAVVDFCAYTPGDIKTLLAYLPGSVSRYVYISTTSVHRNSLSLPMQEDSARLSEPSPGSDGDYAYHKMLLESELMESCEERGIGHVCLRPAFIYGKNNYAARESYFFDLIAKGETIILPPSPQALFTMVSVWDLANVCAACLDNDGVLNGSFTVCAEELISYDRIIEVLEQITGRKFDIRRQPVRLINAAGLPLPFPLEEHLVYSGARLRKLLGYRYMPLLEGLDKTYEWYVHANNR